MQKIINETKRQLEDMRLNNETIDNLNKFFESLNDYLKGGHDTLIIVFRDSYLGGLYSNILNKDIAFYRFPTEFKKVLIEFILNFSDNMELFLDIVMLLNRFNLFELTHDMRLYLFETLLKSGYFCYVPLDREDFLKEWDFIYEDLRVISNIVSCPKLEDMDIFLNETMRDLYLFEDIDLKYILID